MKKRILLFTSSIALLTGMVLSNASGPITMGAGNRTGSQGSTANCSTGGCHATNTTTTNVSISLLDSSNTPVLSWKPGYTYKLYVAGNTTNTSMTKYGFQMSAVYNNGSMEVQAGTFTNPPTNCAIKPSGTLSIVEHSQALPLLAGFTYLSQMNWTAPPVTTIDTVKFYATVNCVNGDNTVAGDAPNTKMTKFYRQTTSVAELNADIKINAYPNPMTDKLNISLENADNGVYSISVFDMHGKVVATQTANVNKSFSTSVNASSWAAGMYHVQLKKGDAQRTIAVVKQ